LVVILAVCAALASLASFDDQPQAQLEGLEGMEPPSDVTDIDCTMCHGDFAQQFEFAHAPAFDGECVVCHLSTGEMGHGGLVDEGRGLCLSCHGDKQAHYAAVTCWTSNCHSDVHGSDVDPFLNPARQEPYPGFTPATAGQDFVGSYYCLSCHSEMSEWWGESVHSLSDGEQDTPRYLRGCESCHGPGDGHWGRKAGIGVFDFASREEADARCLTCHKDETYVPDYERGTHAKNNVGCISCHNPHNVAEKHNLRYDANTMCLNCHETKRMDFGKMSHHPLDLADPRSGMLCVDCHNPHGGEGHSMLAAPQEELCLTCHVDKQGPFVFAHPATDPDMGRGCATCHASHGSNTPDLLTINGRGLCLQCHNDRALHFQGQTCWTSGCHTEHHGSNENFFFFDR
jgi:DmsE family decaheme c-type cytochrome